MALRGANLAHCKIRFLLGSCRKSLLPLMASVGRVPYKSSTFVLHKINDLPSEGENRIIVGLPMPPISGLFLFSSPLPHHHSLSSPAWSAPEAEAPLRIRRAHPRRALMPWGRDSACFSSKENLHFDKGLLPLGMFVRVAVICKDPEAKAGEEDI